VRCLRVMAQNRRLAEEVARLRAEVKRLEQNEEGYFRANQKSFRRQAVLRQENAFLLAEVARLERERDEAMGAA